MKLPGSRCWRQMLLMIATCVNLFFFHSYNLLKTLPATKLLLFGLVTLLCWLKFGMFLFYLMSEGSVKLSNWTPSGRHTNRPLSRLTLTHLSVAAPLLPPLVDQRRNGGPLINQWRYKQRHNRGKMTVVCKVTFIQMARQYINAKFRPWKGSGKGAKEAGLMALYME